MKSAIHSLVVSVLYVCMSHQAFAAEDRRSVENILKTILPNEAGTILVDEKELFNARDHLVKTRSFVFSDFNKDGNRDVALCAQMPNKAGNTDGLFLIATLKKGKWELVYRQQFDSLSLPGLKWHPKKKELFFFGSYQGHEPARHVQWDAKGSSYFMEEVEWTRLQKTKR